MERKAKIDIEIEEFIIMALELSFGKFLSSLDVEVLKIEEEMREIGFSEEEMSWEFERRIKNQIIEKFRMFFDKLITEKDVPLFMIGYCIKRCEGAVQRLKSRGSFQTFVPIELNFLIPKMHLLIEEYVEILERTLQQLRFEYEVI